MVMQTKAMGSAGGGSELFHDLSVEQGTLRTAQKIHAVAIVVVPAIGLIAAVALATRVGVSLLDIGLFVGMFAVTIMGISVGFHRHFTHRSFKAITPVRVILGICGSMAGQGSVTYWVSNHRRHHQYTDRPGDIHSPYIKDDRPIEGIHGFWHSHMGWTFAHRLTNPLIFAKDLYRDKAVVMVNQLYFLWVFLGLLIPFVVGGIVTQTWIGAISGLLWGGLVRLFFTYHVVNGIDSVTHLFGSQAFETHDHSTNNLWMVLPTMGEGWHNNHHAFPNSAIFGLKWWQFDPGGMLIRALEKAGWVWDVNLPTLDMIEQKSASGPA